MTRHIGLLLYPGLTQLDLTGPFEVIHRVPDAVVHLVWKGLDIVVADSGLGLRPTTRLDECSPLDVVMVPGGIGQMGPTRAGRCRRTGSSARQAIVTRMRSQVGPDHCEIPDKRTGR